jgi:glyoxylase-like metal-dependent hydrolase (beta-lactamase superfamily II)
MSTSFRVGDMTIHRLVEMEAGFRPILQFLPNLTPERLAENRPWLLEAGALDPQDLILICFQSHVIVTPHHTILVDGCIGNDKSFPDRARWHRKTDRTWMDALAKAGLTVEDIDYVLCTHLHADHVGWNTQLLDGRWVPTFPNARYLFTETELAFWTAQNAAQPQLHFQESVLPVVEAGRVDLVTSSHALNDHVRLLPTPGHTIDHYAVQLGVGRDDAVLTGDLIHSPLQARYPDLTMRLDHDPALAVQTRRAFLERYCDTDTLCCFAHFPSPTKGTLKRWGEGFRCEYVT